MSRYLWCEDSGSGFQFWCAIFHELLPDVLVETKKGNTGLRKAAGRIAYDENQYYIIMDSAVDNADVLRENRCLRDVVHGKDNVHIVSLHSFEFALLSFAYLEQWVFAEKDKLKEKRKDLLQKRSLFVELLSDICDCEALLTFKEVFKDFSEKNSEQIAAKLLHEITRNTGFETDKAKLGECFVVSCCEWANRQSEDICGLDTIRLISGEKAKLLVEHSVLKKVFERSGLINDNGI